MNAKQTLDAILKIAEVHADRLSYALTELTNREPITAEVIANIPRSDLGLYELYSSRFAKLQDWIGARLFSMVLNYAGENIDSLSFIDKLLRVEKLGILEDANHWLNLRELRNLLTHEYPEAPELMAKYMNAALSEGGYLLSCLERIKAFVHKTEEARKKIGS